MSRKRTSTQNFHVMSSIKGKNTKLEQSISKAIWRKGFRFRKNVRSLYGKPDISIKKYKVVIFIDSCFWHGCRQHYKPPTKNLEYWSQKIERNIQRDKEVSNYYLENNWSLIRVWEHDIKIDHERIINQICNCIASSMKRK
ncbi:very short patch repair endonuclease [Paenibacillus sp. NPDC056579]|uniref:very short patch repair endonuclease n=1 Tax=Paenibacillus sp. NPDC056579 TaxID=3345871 RepID=UPI0036B1D476